jgi:hypothetical protein
MVAKATAEMKPRNTLPPTALDRCTAATLLPPSSVLWHRGTAGHQHEGDGAGKSMMKVRGNN